MTNKSRKRGIALIIVLGMLALLVMVGVAFSIFMRTERQAAGSFQHDVRARQLLYASAARAIQTINENMVGKTYPTDNYWVSPGTNFFAITTNQLWAAHVPDSLLTQIPNAASWVTVPNGRIGFMILNASGLLDANVSGGAARGSGLDPTEIQLSELNDINNINTFIGNRKYESVAQIKRAGTATGVNGLSHFVPFSLLSTNVSTQPIDISGDVADLNVLKGQITGRLQMQTNGVELFPSVDANTVFEALLDYVDSDSKPSNLLSPTTEKIPMINEIRIRPRLIRTGNPDILNLQFVTQVELMYPFVSLPASTAYDLVYTVTFERAVGTDAGFPLPTVPPNTTVKLDTDFSWSGQPFLDIALSIPMVQVSITALTGKTGAFRLRINEMKIVERSSGTAVDSLRANMLVGSGADLASYLPRVTVPAASMTVWGETGGSECLDPRYNYAAAFWRSYSQVVTLIGNPAAINGSPAAINEWTSYWLREKNNDGHMWMHVANRPIESVGELSYLVRGLVNIDEAWKTLRLLDERSPADPLYDHFMVPLTNTISRGLVNPNTDANAILAAAFKDMKLDRYPGDTADAAVCKISSAEAKQLATAWMSDPTWDAGYSSKQGMVGNLAYKRAVSNLVNSMLGSLSAPAAPEFRVEGAFRNMIGLMNPLQNYFYIVLFAQSSTRVQLPRAGDTPGVFIDTVRSDQIGLLELWRDPVMRVANGTTNYPMLIRRFEILSQD
jgi:hypothetical protein